MTRTFREIQALFAAQGCDDIGSIAIILNIRALEHDNCCHDAAKIQEVRVKELDVLCSMQTGWQMSQLKNGRKNCDPVQVDLRDQVEE